MIAQYSPYIIPTMMPANTADWKTEALQNSDRLLRCKLATSGDRMKKPERKQWSADLKVWATDINMNWREGPVRLTHDDLYAKRPVVDGNTKDGSKDESLLIERFSHGLLGPRGVRGVFIVPRCDGAPFHHRHPGVFPSG